MVRVCLQCSHRLPDSDDEYGACTRVLRNGRVCGSKQWAIVDAPEKPYQITKEDRRYLKSIRIAPE